MRLLWIGFGIGTHLLFAFTVLRLYPFLEGTSHGYAERLAAAMPGPWYLVDLVLVTQFGLLHSWLLHPRTRKKLAKLIPSPQYGCFFCVTTCLSLLLTIEGWQHSAGGLWHLEGWPGWAMHGAFLLSWAALLYSLHLTGLGFQTGFTPWWAWVRGQQSPSRTFAPRGAYRWLRHPVYLSFLGLIWCTTLMTWDRVILVAVWTAYIFVGSYLKDQRLLFYLGDTYREYQARIPGYPFFPVGPLARVPLAHRPVPASHRQPPARLAS